MSSEIGGLRHWNNISGERIPGSTRIPIKEINEYFQGSVQGLVGLDLGSGGGRSTKELNQFFPKCGIIALDLCHSGLLRTPQVNGRVQGRAEELPFKKDAFDFVNVCGVMTNIVDRDAKNAKELRERVLKGLWLIMKPGGCLVISDFSAEHMIDDYPVNYDRHVLITGERGTIAVLKSGETFQGKSNEEVTAMKGTLAVERFAHHYTPRELIELLKNADFSVLRYSVENALTPKGKRPIENIIITAMKSPIEQSKIS